MAITRYAGDRFTIGGSPDTEPTGVLDGAFLINTGNLSQKVLRNGTWTTLAGGGGGSPGGSNTQVQFNDNGAFGGTTGLTFDGQRLYANNFQLSGILYDSNASVGEGGMVLTNEGQTGVNWKSIESVLSGVGGSGVANYVARWSDEDTLTSGTIFDNGDVGIGTDNPQYLLEVYGDATLNSSSATTDATLRLEAAGATKWRIKNDTQVGGGTADTLTFTSAGDANVSISQTGHFGIGTNNPSAMLDVLGPNAAGTFFNARNNGAAGAEFKRQNHAVYPYNYFIFHNGYVGIGTTTPATLLNVYSALANANGIAYIKQAVATNTPTLVVEQTVSGGNADVNQGLVVKAVGTSDGSGNTLHVYQRDNSATGLVVKGSGKVGIGNNRPIYQLHLQDNSAGGKMILMRQDTSLTGQMGEIAFGQRSYDDYVCKIRATLDSTATTAAGCGGFLSFDTEESGGDLTERLRISSDGKVGIGVTDPTQGLTLKTPASGDAFFIKDRSSTDDIIRMSYGGATDEGLLDILKDNAIKIRFRANASSYMIGGSFGIGTTSPSEYLEVNGGNAKITSSSNVYLSLDTTQTNGDEWHIFNAVSGTKSGLQFKDIDTSKLVMLLQEDGNVGIGTASPGAPLEVYSADNQLVKITSTDAYAEITFADDTTSTRPYIGALGDNLYLYGAGVGVGTVTPAANQKLDVKFADDVNGAGVTFRNTDGSLQFQNVAGSANQFNPQVKGNSKHVNNVGLRLLGNAASGEDSGTTPLILLRGTVNDAKATTRPVLHVEDGAGDKLMAITADGNVGIGDNLIAPEHRLHVSGDAIISGVLYDSTNSSGVAGHVFTSEAGGPQWKMIEDVLSGVGGNGTENYVPKWEDSDTIGNSIIYDDGTNVGISTVTPSGKFHVYGGAGRFDVTNAATKDHHLTVSEGNATDWRPYAGSTTAALQLQSLEDLTGDARGILLAVKSEGNPELTTSEGLDINVNATVGTNNGTLAVKVQSDGNVGIGTNSTSELLHAYKAVDAAVAIAVENPNAGTDARARIQLMSNGGTATLTTYSAAFTTSNQNIADSALLRASSLSGGLGLSADGATPLRFWTNDTERIRVDSGGNVGVGTTTPKTLLEASGVIRSTHATSVTAGVGIEMLYNNTDGTGYLYSYDRDGSAYKTTRIGSESYFIADGNVGIATATPEHQFQVYGDALISGKFYDSTNSTGDKGYVLTSDDSGPLWKTSGDFDGLSGNLIATGQTLTSIILVTGQTLQSQVTANDGDISTLTNNLITTGQTLQTQITANDGDISTLTSNLITTGQTLQTQITSNDGDISTLTSNLITTGQTLQTQITSNDTDIATNATNIATNVTNLVATGQFLTNALPVGANPTAVISGAATDGTATTFMRSDAAPALKDTEVTAGSYTYAAITVNAQGRLTAASNGTAPGGGTVTGTGTANYVSKWTGTNSQGISSIFDNNSQVTIDVPVGIVAGSGSGTLTGRLQIGSTTSTANNSLVFWRGAKPTLAANQGAILYENGGMSDGEGMTFMSDKGYKFLDDAGTTEWVRIKSDGNVGIGTDAPGAELEVSKTSADATLTVTRTDQQNIKLVAAGHSYVRASAALILQSNGANNRLTLAADGSSTFSGALTFGGTLTGNSGDLIISNTAVNSDIIIKGERTAGTVTALTFDISDGGAATFSSKIQTGNITLENTQISQTSGNLKLDVAGNITLDSNTGVIDFDDGGTNIGRIENSSSDFKLESRVQDKDMIFVGNDNGTGFIALTLDMSDSGTAIFSHDIKIADNGKAIFGDSSDLQIYHDTLNSYITDSGTGGLVLATSRLHVNNAASNQEMISATQGGAVELFHNNVKRLETTSGGVTVTGTLTETSSITLKENVETYTPSLDIINKIRPVRYNRKTNKDKKEIGLIAEELAELFPELVEKDEKGNPSSVNYSRAVTVLLGGFKELYKEVKELKEKI